MGQLNDMEEKSRRAFLWRFVYTTKRFLFICNALCALFVVEIDNY